jgi:hypothetical protein
MNRTTLLKADAAINLILGGQIFLWSLVLLLVGISLLEGLSHFKSGK